MDVKTVKKIIANSKDDGKNDQEIYNDLSEHYSNKKNLALLITGTATKENKRKYKLYNNILIGLLALTLLSRIIVSFFLIKEGIFLEFIFSLIGLLLPALLIYGVMQYSAPFYRLCGILATMGFITSLVKQHDTTSILLDLIPIAAVAVLAFFLSFKMFPNFKPRQLKKDTNGNYLLG